MQSLILIFRWPLAASGLFQKKFLFFITLYSAFGLKVEEKKVLLKCYDRIYTTLLCSSGEGVGGCGID